MSKKVIKTRDYAMVKLINGATKAAVHKDHRKEALRVACRADELRAWSDELEDD